MSDAQSPNDAEAEPVDAEFEPAPGAASKPMKTKTARRTPWLTVLLVTVLAGTVGGGTGWLIGAHGPDPERAALTERIAALEASAEASSADTTGVVEGLDTRLSAVEAEMAGGRLRAQGIEQLIRDVASLRTQVAALASAEPSAETAPSASVAGLEERVDAALAGLGDRISLAETAAETARTQAEQAQSAIQNALNLMAQTPAAPPQGDNTTPSGPAAAPAITSALAQAEARLAVLEASREETRRQIARLNDVETALASLREAVSAPQERADDLTARLDALEAAVTALQAGAVLEAPQEAERAVAFAALSRAVSTDEPFPVALADLRRIWPTAPGADGLVSIARAGAPMVDQLIASFPVTQVRAATGEAQMLFGVIRVEREGEAGPTNAIEAALEAEDLAAAVAAAQSLDETARAEAADWLRRAEARLAVERALAQMSDALSVNAGADR